MERIKKKIKIGQEEIGINQYKYYKDENDREFDYENYVKIQTEGNKRKIQSQWVEKPAIKFLSEYILTLMQPNFGICHGTRRGLEQAAFREYLSCEVIGTEISDTASQFPHTIQWDFHEVKPEWLNAADFIYSNSWDHSYDPDLLFRSWMSCVRVNGIMILEHSSQQIHVTELDPLGMQLTSLCKYLELLGKEKWKILDVIQGPLMRKQGGFEERGNNVIVQKLANDNDRTVKDRTKESLSRFPELISQLKSKPSPQPIKKDTSLPTQSLQNNQNFPWLFTDGNVDIVFWELLNFFQPNIVCDIGSLDGSASIKIREILPNANIFAFEANPENFFDYGHQVLKKNIHFLHLALSNLTGQKKIYVPKTGTSASNAGVPQRGTASLLPKSNQRECITYDVPVSTLDMFFAGFTGNVNSNYYVLWIDVEGLAWEVLQGGIQRVIPKTCLVKAQIEGRQHWKNQKLDTDVRNLMSDLGFVEVANNMNSVKRQQSKQYDAIFINSNLCNVETARRFLLEVPSIKQSKFTDGLVSQTDIQPKMQKILFVFPVNTKKIEQLALESYHPSSLVKIIKRLGSSFEGKSKLEYFNELDFSTNIPEIDKNNTIVIARAPHRLEKTFSEEALEKYRRLMTSVKRLYLIHFGAPSELHPSAIEKEIYANARHLFCWCSNYSWEVMGLGEMAESMGNRISRLEPAIASDLIPYRPRFKPGQLSFLHISNLALNREPHLILASLPQDSQIFIGSEKLTKKEGHFTYQGKDRQKRRVRLDFAYKPIDKFKLGEFENIRAAVQINGSDIQRNFLLLGYVTEGVSSEFSQFINSEINYYIHLGANDMTAILEASARGILPCVSGESGLNFPSAVYLTDDLNKNRTILYSLNYMKEKEYLIRVEHLRQWVIEKHSWQKTLSDMQSVIDNY